MKKFEVPVWWYELHGGNITVEAKTAEDAINKVGASLENMVGDITGETFSAFGESGIDDEDVKELVDVN